MKFSLVFENSGDSLPFESVNSEVLIFYVNQLNQQGLNKFSVVNQNLGKTILGKIEQFRACIVEVNTWLYDLADMKIGVYEIEDYLNQDILNEIHADWVKSQSLIYNIQEKRKQFNFSGIAEQIYDKFPDDIQTLPLSTVIDRIGKIEIYRSLNDPHIHSLENSFNAIDYQVSDIWTIVADNPFPKNILTNDIANLSITFNNLGRTLHNKYTNFDMNLKYSDENSYDQLLGFVTLSLVPSQTIPLSMEYINWCKLHNKVPSGTQLNIGNIPNLYENLTKYRKIIFHNLLSNNTFSIQQIKG
jgi:hypothetical protein